MRIHPSIVSTAKFSSSIVMVCATTIIAAQIYETALQVFKGAIPCPGIDLSALACAMVATSYCSWKLSPFYPSEMPSSSMNTRYLRPIKVPEDKKTLKEDLDQSYHDVQEIVAFSPPRGASQ